MTRAPKTISDDTALETISAEMKRLNVRHFPVERNGVLVGVVSDRNVKAAHLNNRTQSFKAEDVMISEPFVVPPHSTLDTVVSAMADEKVGCAIIQQDAGEIVGIFTTTDACRALSQILRTLYPL
jgi:CBS domain-containing protein